MRLRSAALAGCLGIVAAAGVWTWFGSAQDGAAELELVPVRGVVFKGDRPLELRADDFGKIWFHPDASKSNTLGDVPAGDISADGQFIIFTRGKEGAPAGRYRVAVLVNRTRDASHPNQKRKSLIPDHFGNPQTSGLAFQVAADRPAGAYDVRVPK